MGDEVMRAKGSIHIPFYAQDAVFSLVVDAKRRRVAPGIRASRTEMNSAPRTWSLSSHSI